MHSSKLFKVLAVLSKEEWLEMRHFIKHRRSTSPQVKALFAYIFQRRTNLESKIFTLEHVKSKAFEGMSKKNLQNMMSKLTLVIEDYLIMQHVQEDQYEKELRRFQVYNDRGLFELANNKVDKLSRTWGDGPGIDLSLFMYLLRMQHYQYFSENPISSQQDKKPLHNLMSTFGEFSQIYAHFYEFVNEHAISINDPDVYDKQNKFEHRITRQNLQVIIAIKKLHTTNDIVSFKYLYKYLRSEIYISSEMKTIIFEFCERFLRTKIIKDDSKEYVKKILDFYDFGMDVKLLLYKGAISTIRFQNIIQIACFAQAFKWADSFLEKNVNLVPETQLKENVSFAAIQISFGKSLYNEVVTMALTNDFKIFTFKLRSRWYLLVCYYVVHDSFEFMESQINNYNQFFYYNKKRISKMNFEGSLNLSKIIKLAISTSKIQVVFDEMKKYDNVIFKKRLPTFFEQREIYIQKNDVRI